MKSCKIAIKAVPNASRSEIVGWLGDALKVKVKAPPVDGKANTELCRFLAETLDLPRSAVALTSGETARQKHVQIEGRSAEEVHRQLGRPIA
jgi:uncharacterized protein